MNLLRPFRESNRESRESTVGLSEIEKELDEFSGELLLSDSQGELVRFRVDNSVRGRLAQAESSSDSSTLEGLEAMEKRAISRQNADRAVVKGAQDKSFVDLKEGLRVATPPGGGE